MIEAGIRPSNKHRQVGDYKLNKLARRRRRLSRLGGWQHVSVDTIQRRVRIYTVATASNPEARANRVRQARREFEVLEGIDHPGILKRQGLQGNRARPALDLRPRPQGGAAGPPAS